MNLMLLLLLILYSHLSFAHGGGVDSSGGHNERKTGEYHCHREPCLSIHNQTTKAMGEAEGKGVVYSKLYNRDDWGHWIDADGDCQDTRGEILIRDSLKPVTYHSNAKCRVTGGLWELPYIGGTVTNAQQLDIDHIIPLKWAHGHGGDRWSSTKKSAFANDPDNLLATSSSTNRSKGAKGPDQWLPSINKCSYAQMWEQLIEKYRLMTTAGEVEAIAKVCQ
jgi:hypothetical protein